MSPALREAVLAGADVTELTRVEMQPASLREDARRLIAQGWTDENEVKRVLGC
jgi:hypothetical protein